VKAKLLDLGIIPRGDSTAEFSGYVKDQIVKWKHVIDVSNIDRL
jgi:hypothetical protein